MTLFDERRHQKAASQLRFTLIEPFMHSKKVILATLPFSSTVFSHLVPTLK